MYQDEFSSCDMSIKKSVKWLEVPIQKFNTVIPHFVDSFKNHHTSIVKLQRLGQYEEMQKEHKKASRIVNQLKSLLNEMENLRTQVLEQDLNKFDKLINSSKHSAIESIQTYQALRIQPYQNANVKDQNPNIIVSEESQQQQIQALADLTETIEIQERRAASADRLHEDIEDLNCMFQELSQLVHHQGEAVEKIEEHVETTHSNVVEGEKMLCQAVKYKNGIYPVLGAVIGTVVGGPVGLLAGFKLGGLTAVGCGFLGFTGGKIMKNLNEESIVEADRHREDLKS